MSLDTQSFVPINRIRDGIITLDNGELRAVLMVSSLNLALKSEEEQMAVLSQFQSFLNTIDFNVEIFVQSRRLDIRPYINALEERSLKVTEDLLKVQIEEYIGFIKTFTDNTNIMTKQFFIVVPYLKVTLTPNDNKSIFSSLGIGGDNKNINVELEDKNFQEARTQLEQRINTVSLGLSRSGLRITRLGTEEVVELFYKLFNPGELDKPVINNLN